MTYSDHKDSKIKDMSGPTLTGSEADFNGARSSGLFVPEQQSFLGASIQSFSVQNGDGSTPASLNVDLVEDPSFNNYVISKDGPGGFTYDPYHNGTSDHFNPPAVGMPVFFVYANPRKTIEEAFYPSSYSLPTGESIFRFGGILQSFHQTNSIGGRTFSATVQDPREILSSIYLILNHSDVKVGEHENNVFNVFGFLEHNPTDATRTMFDGYTANLLTRSHAGDQLGGDDMYWKVDIPALDPAKGERQFTKYFESLGYTNKFPITGTAMSRRGSYGIPYYRVMQGLAAMSGSLPSEDEYGNFSGGIYYRGLSYSIDFFNLPELAPLYCFDQDNTDLLSFILEVAEASGSEISISLSPSKTSTSANPIGGIINISFIDRSMESSVGGIRSFIKNNVPQSKDLVTGYGTEASQFSQSEKEDIGYEATNPNTGKIIFGGNRVDLYAFTSNHDDGRFNALQNEQVAGGGQVFSNQIEPFYGTLSNNVVVPTRGKGLYKQVLLDSSGLGAFGVGNYYVTTEVELRYAAKGFKAWKNFLEFFNSKYLEKLCLDPRSRYQDIMVGGDVENLKLSDSDGESTRGLKVPRCLFTNDTGFKDGKPKNPCSPPYGFPLYYGRAAAIGLSLEDIVDPRFKALTDIEFLRGTSGDNIQKVVNVLIDKYRQLKNMRKITKAEKDLLASLEEGNVNSDYLTKAAESLRSQVYTGGNAKDKKNRKENVQKIFNFVRSVATECYGKKYLVRIPTKPNYNFETDDEAGVTLNGEKNLYLKGYFGFKARKAIPSAEETVEGSFVATSNDPNVSVSQAKYHRALVTNYNPIDNAFAHNFTPNPAGGFLTQTAYSKALLSALVPKDLTSFGSNHRIKAYVRYDHAEHLSIGSTKCYTEKVQQTSDVNDLRDKSIPKKLDSFDNFSASVSGETIVAFMPVELDEAYYFWPQTMSRNVQKSGKAKTIKTELVADPIVPDEEGKFPEAAKFKTYKRYKPLYQNDGNKNITDFPRSDDGKIMPYPDTAYAYALITMPESVTVKRDSINDIPVKNNFDAATYLNTFGDDADLNTVSHVQINKRLDLAGQGASLTFYNPNRLFSAPPSIPPDIVVLPIENEQACYGPWYTGPVRTKNSQTKEYEYKIIKNAGGSVDIEMDESLTPWNFGSYELMNTAGASRSEIMNTLYFASEKGSVTFPGLPLGLFDIGNVANSAGPILDSVSFDVGVGGVHTSYRFQTHTRSFGTLKKQQQKSLDLLKRNSLKIGKENFQLYAKGLVKSKFSGGLPKGTVKPYESFYEPASDYPHDTRMSGFSKLTSPSHPRDDSKIEFAQQASTMSSEAMQESADATSDVTSHARDFYNTAIEQSSDGQIAVSMEPHANLPSVENADQEALANLYNQPTDEYNLGDHQITFWS
tara:strand:+ start:66298 stop:70464 length:4167 start_codon:yes stop_codon:yes gene_type:complete